MKKRDEIKNPNSCWSKGREDERMFVLLARDSAAPDTVRFWANLRMEQGKNGREDPQIVEALDCADRMEDEAKHINYRPHGGGMAGVSDPAEETALAVEIRRHRAASAADKERIKSVVRAVITNAFPFIDTDKLNIVADGVADRLATAVGALSPREATLAHTALGLWIESHASAPHDEILALRDRLYPHIDEGGR